MFCARLFFDEAVRPDLLHQFFFVENMATVFDQKQQQVEGLWRQRHRPLSAQQDTLGGIYPKDSRYIEKRLAWAFLIGFQNSTSAVYSNYNAGMELDIRLPEAPYIIKGPSLCDYLDDVLEVGI